MPHPDTLGAHSLVLFRNGKYSDLTVTCSDRTWKCHRNILCPRCPFFEAACDGNFKESETLVVKLDDDSPDGVDVMLEYLYTLEPPIFENAFRGSPARAEGAFIMGDKYDLAPLKKAGHERLVYNVKKFVDCWRRNSNNMREQTQQAFINSIAELWVLEQEGSSSVRDSAVEYLCTIPAVIRDSRPFRTLIDNNPAFRTDFIRHILSNMESQKREPED